MCFHIWPSSLPGGFIGVDVFFVISGFLITGILIREAEKTGTLSIRNFYARRIRRLFPMAGLVLGATLLALPLMPKAFWPETIYHVLASTFYVENLWLAAQSIDYLDSENLPGPLQHFWSLSVEEQFYMFWPLLIILACKWNNKKNTPHQIRKHAVYTLATITTLSFIISVILTQTDRSLAYFITLARLWELGLGGLLALLPLSFLRTSINTTLALIGLSLIIYGSWFISSASDFPGYLAILPTAGAVLLLIASPDNPVNARLLGNPAMKYIGDISYSLYLWHWPIIIFAKYQGWQPDLLSGFAIFGLTFLLSAVSKPVIEDYFLKSEAWKTSDRKAFTLAFGTMGILVIACSSLFMTIQPGKSFSPDALHPGILIAGESMKNTHKITPIPPLEFVKRDLPDLYAHGCHASHAATTPLTPCKAGPKESPVKIFLIGDSHAAQWWPALKSLADKNNWQISSYTKSSCAPLDTDTLHDGKLYTECRDWAIAVEDDIKRAPPSVIIYTQAADQRLAKGGDQASQSKIMAEILRKKWQTWKDMGIKVIIVADTPVLGRNYLECLGTDQECPAQSRKNAPDPVLEAITSDNQKDIRLINPSPLICPQDICPPVIGNIVVWRDTHHITATIAQSFSDIFETEIKAALTE
jgi:peptidoglycan/LPS O-acetylase OafA/YrhL